MVTNLAPFESSSQNRQLADNFRRPRPACGVIDHFMVMDGGRIFGNRCGFGSRVGDSHSANSKHRFTTSFLRELEGFRKARLGYAGNGAGKKGLVCSKRAGKQGLVYWKGAGKQGLVCWKGAGKQGLVCWKVVPESKDWYVTLTMNPDLHLMARFQTGQSIS